MKGKQLRQLQAVQGQYANEWRAFYCALWMDIDDSEVGAYLQAIYAPDADADRWETVDVPGTDDEAAVWGAWFGEFIEAMPPDDQCDFAKWPDLLPQPPAEPEDAWKRCRELTASEDRIERQVGAYTLVILAAGRAVRRRADPFSPFTENQI